ncbi:hypothetical protein SLA2020_360610 [Shorea laevis]
MARQIFVQRIKHLWTGWEIRLLVLLSLLLQMILIIFGAQRKCTRKTWIHTLVWLAYTSADSIATLALGNLAILYCKEDAQNPDYLLKLFWAPFLLLHLGGPDTITAYSLEDNELWLRHFLNLMVISAACSLWLSSWGRDNALAFIAIPVFVGGIIKYGERTWVLRSSSSKYFRNSLLPPPAGPDYFKLSRSASLTSPIRAHLPHHYINPELMQLRILFKNLKYLFADLILDFQDREHSHLIISSKSPEDAFKLVAIELGLMYDVLYTKANIVYSRSGIVFRCITCLSSIAALVAFSFIIDKKQFSAADIFITYTLLVGAVALEIYAAILLIFSDWIKLHGHRIQGTLPNRRRWSKSIAQCNLIGFCLRYRTLACIKVQKLLGIYEMLQKSQNNTWVDINADLQALIFTQLKNKSDLVSSDIACKKLLELSGSQVLEKYGCLNEFRWNTADVEFNHILLLWHIATEICFQNDFGGQLETSIIKKAKISKWLSDYMLYLLVKHPNFLPKGIGEIRYRDTCADAVRFFRHEWGRIFDPSIKTRVVNACKVLLEVDMERRGDQSKSLLIFGRNLAKRLQQVQIERKWEMTSEVWVELLAYAASHCDWKKHGQLLTNGGELLTHVCLLMAHLGLSEQYQIEEKLIRSEVFHTSPPAGPDRGQRWFLVKPWNLFSWFYCHFVKYCCSDPFLYGEA